MREGDAVNGERRYTVTTIEGFLSTARTGRGPGVSYHVIDTLWNRRIVATYRSEEYTAHGRMWARMGAEDECSARNAAMERLGV